MNVSCCGVFNHINYLEPTSMIAYNLISYTKFSVLVLTTFANQHHTLDSFLSSYELPDDLERLLNEIAFFKSEEPLISPRLWQSLDENTKLEVRKSLVHPAWREIDTPPTIIKLAEEDIMLEVPREVWEGM